MPRPRSILGPLLAGLALAGTGASAGAATPAAPASAAKPAAPKTASEKSADKKVAGSAPSLPPAKSSESAQPKAAPAAKPAENKTEPAKPSAPPAAKSSAAPPAAKPPSLPAVKNPPPKEATPKPAEPKAAVAAADPKRGTPQRKVEGPGAAAPAKSGGGAIPSGTPAAAKPSRSETAALPKAPSHQRGKAPRKPAASLPSGAARPGANRDARRQVAGGLTADDVRAGKDNPELRALRDAERVLFPRELPGLTPGWSWDLPRPAITGGAEVVSSGLPPGAPRAAASAPTGPEHDWVKRLTLPNLPVRWDERVIKYLKFYRDSPSGRNVARAFAKKSGKFVRALKGELGKSGLPSDLVWLSLIESGHNPTIVSPAGAVGLWQFMPDAGRSYGLVVDRWVDERLDPDRATEAAARYLGDLHRRFGSWDLAMAAYNMGYGGLSRAIRKFSSNDFWQLSRYEAGIPWETTLYVPKILATAIMMNNPASFGIADVVPEPPESFDTVQVGPGTPLEAVARAAGVPVEAIEDMNPQYLAGRTPPAAPGRRAPSYRVRVPAGKGSGASRLLALETPPTEGLTTYVVRSGDTTGTIAALVGTNEAKVRSLNRVGSQEVLAPGTVVLVPEPERRPAEVADTREEVVVVSREVVPPGGTEQLFYRVVSGDTLGKIADAFGVARAEILSWNALDEGARLVPGMTLQVFVRRGQAVSARCLKHHEARVLVAGTPQFFDYHEGLNGKKRIVVTAREGDTLASVGRRYGMTVGWMERVNRRSRSDKLEPGETLVVYTERPEPGVPPLEFVPSKVSEPVPPMPEMLPPAEVLAGEPP